MVTLRVPQWLYQSDINQEKKDTIYRRTDQSEEQFIAKAIRSVCHFVEKALPVMHI